MSFCILEILDMSNVKEIKYAVTQDNLLILTYFIKVVCKILKGKDFGVTVYHEI